MGVLDRGLLPDATVAAACPIRGPAAIGSPNDARRIRAALVTVLRRAADNGDALLGEAEALDHVSKLDLERPVAIDHDWLVGNELALNGEVARLNVLVDAERDIETACLQLNDMRDREARLRSLLSKRAAKALPSLGEDWETLLRSGLPENDDADERHRAALAEKAAASRRSRLDASQYSSAGQAPGKQRSWEPCWGPGSWKGTASSSPHRQGARTHYEGHRQCGGYDRGAVSLAERTL